MYKYIKTALAATLLAMATPGVAHVDARDHPVIDKEPSMSMETLQQRAAEFWEKSRILEGQCERTKSALKAKALESELNKRIRDLEALVGKVSVDTAAMQSYGGIARRNNISDVTDLDLLGYTWQCDIPDELMPHNNTPTS